MEDKEKRILDGARDLFCRYGYKKTSIDEIAESAGFGKGTIYNYFKNKEDLFLHSSKAIQKEMQIELNQILDNLQRADDKLIHVVLHMIRFIRKISKEYNMSKKVLEELIYVGMDLNSDSAEYKERTLPLLLEGVEQGIFKSGNHLKNTELLYQILRKFFVRWAVMKFQEAESEIRNIFELIFNGLRR